jgi:hypothetical protein
MPFLVLDEREYLFSWHFPVDLFWQLVILQGKKRFLDLEVNQTPRLLSTIVFTSNDKNMIAFFGHAL